MLRANLDIMRPGFIVRICERTHITSAMPEVPYGRCPGHAYGPWKLSGFVLLSRAIWTLFLSILIQNGIKK